MTGFGKAEGERYGLHVTIELRSVNHRFCEISVRLPKALAGLEPQVRQLLSSRLVRGRISAFISLNGERDEQGELVLDALSVDRYFRLLKELKKKYRLEGSLDIKTMASFPDLFVRKPPQVNEKKVWPWLATLLKRAVGDLSSAQEQEGRILARDMRKRITKIRRTLTAIKNSNPVRVRKARKALRSRIASLIGDAEIDEQRFATEVALMADKSDATEECVRLGAHIDQFSSLLRSRQSEGRKMNFLLQEMNREINTLGAKSTDVAVARYVVEIKEEIEKVREQVQNFQ
jgi:uncharacterized protein (TIGR00255 family)